ncbi:MAG: VCBS repeat-containing protein [Ignavibacteriales bacterium]|nr:VCBS repeat-containing protein [Ignavibacteriales bacterium]
MNLFYVSSFSQVKLQTAFGLVIEHHTPKNPQELFVGDFNGDARLDFGVRSRSILALYRKNSLGFWVRKQLLFRAPSKSVTVADFNNDNYDDIAVLEPPLSAVEVFWGGVRDSLVSTIISRPGEDFENITSLDINNDAKMDFLLYGKFTTGISVVLQKEENTFRIAKKIFPDVSIATLRHGDFNGDGLSDLIFYDWVNEKLQLYLQRGRLKFTLGYEWELREPLQNFIIGDCNGDGSMDVAIHYTGEKSLSFFYGSEDGNFVEAQWNGSVTISQFALADVNGDKRKDIILTEKNQSSLSLFWNDEKNPLQENLTFSTVNGTDEFISAPVEGAAADILQLDKNKNIITEFVNTRNVAQQEEPRSYVVGKHPLGITSVIAENGNLPDLALANEGSNTISILKNRGKKNFDGQFGFEVQSSPSTISEVANSGEPSFIITHKKNNRLTYVTTNYHSALQKEIPFMVSSDQIASTENSDIQWKYFDSTSQSLRCIIEYGEKKYGIGGVNRVHHSLSFFREISSGQFIESGVSLFDYRTFFGTAISDVTRDGIEDILFAAEDADFHRVGLFLAKGKRRLQNFADSTNHFYFPTKILTLMDTSAAHILLWNVDVNNDGRTDIVGNINGTANNLFVSLAGKNQTFLAPTQRLSNIHISQKSLAQFYDYNHDGNTDIIFFNEIGQALRICYGRGNGTFQNPRRIIGTERIGGFVAGDFDGDGNSDIAITETERGVVTIYYGK